MQKSKEKLKAVLFSGAIEIGRVNIKWGTLQEDSLHP